MTRNLSLPEIFLIAGSRVALGFGVGLLVSEKLNKDQRRAAGVALALVGGLSTIPLAWTVVSRKPGSHDIEVAA